MRIAVVGGGITGLAAARCFEQLDPGAQVVLIERSDRLGGKLVTERADGFLIEGAPDSFLSRKERGVGLCEELGLADELVGRRPENARSFVKRGGALHPLPEGLTGMIPTNLDALVETALLSPEGRERLTRETEVPPAAAGGDESIASFVRRRLGQEAYMNLVEPLLTGIYGGDGEQLSLLSTFPNLRALELEHGSVIRGLLAQSGDEASSTSPFFSLRSGMETLATALVGSLERTRLMPGVQATAVRALPDRYAVELRDSPPLEVDGVVLAIPAFATAELLAELDPELAALHTEIPYASSAIVTLAYGRKDVSHPLDGYGYVVPQSEGTDIVACTWTSSKWEGRAPAERVLIRVYAGRFGGGDVTALADERLVELAREEVRFLGIEAEPQLARIHRWPRAMPQYVLGHPERLGRIGKALDAHRGLALAGAAYRGVGIPDCIRSGEEAAEAVTRALERVPG